MTIATAHLTPLPTRVFLIEEQANPSSDFFVLPVLRAHGFVIRRVGFSDEVDADDLSDSIVVFVRYVPKEWLKLIETVRSSLKAVVFFMDDDVLDPESALGMPWRYQLKLRRLASSRANWLRKQRAELWVSTAYLLQKYASWRPQLILPSAVPSASGLCKLFYHGSASHAADIRWLKPVVAEALQANTSLCFEIIGGQSVYQLYKNLPRTSVVHPMKWPAYQAFTALQSYDVGLNPLIATRFNKARSHSKFFDITRFNAVGIYSPDSACAEIVDSGVNGLIVDLNESAWVAAILRLAGDAALRQRLLANAAVKMQQLSDQAEQEYLRLFADSGD